MAQPPEHYDVLEAPMKRLFAEVTKRFPELRIDTDTVGPNEAAFRLVSDRGDFAVRVEGSKRDPRGGPGLYAAVTLIFPEDYRFPEGSNEQILKLSVVVEMLSPGSGIASKGRDLLITHENFPDLVGILLEGPKRPWQKLVDRLENVTPATMPHFIVEKLMELRRTATIATGGKMA